MVFGEGLDVKTPRWSFSMFSNEEHNPFLGNFKANHDELAGVQGINLFVSLSTTIFLFVSPNFIEYWRSYIYLNLTQFPATSVAFEALFLPNHGELDVISLFVSLRTMIFIFESLDFVKYWQSYERLKFV